MRGGALNGYVKSSPDFDRQRVAIKGAGQLLLKVFGERGKHARKWIGVSDLSGHMPVEMQLILEVRR